MVCNHLETQYPTIQIYIRQPARHVLVLRKTKATFSSYGHRTKLGRQRYTKTDTGHEKAAFGKDKQERVKGSKRG